MDSQISFFISTILQKNVCIKKLNKNKINVFNYTFLIFIIYNAIFKIRILTRCQSLGTDSLKYGVKLKTNILF